MADSLSFADYDVRKRFYLSINLNFVLFPGYLGAHLLFQWHHKCHHASIGGYGREGNQHNPCWLFQFRVQIKRQWGQVWADYCLYCRGHVCVPHKQKLYFWIWRLLFWQLSRNGYDILCKDPRSSQLLVVNLYQPTALALVALDDYLVALEERVLGNTKLKGLI